MRTFTVIFYAGVLILIGLGLMLFSLAVSMNFLQAVHIEDFISYLQYHSSIRVVVALSGLLLILISLSLAQIILGRFQREKTIAFTTASGEVTIALSAVEDLIKQFVFMFQGIKELKPDVIATKKGIMVKLRVVLRSEANLPELTGKLQDVTRNKLQEVLGIEEAIIVKIHIAKIISKDERDKKKREQESDKNEAAVPYPGFGRI